MKLSDRIHVREMVEEDVDRLFEIYSDGEAMIYRGSNPMESIEEAIQYVHTQKSTHNNRSTIRKGVETLDNGELIGSIMYRYDRSTPSECEIGYSIGRKYWGKGLGNEIIKVMIKTLDQNQYIKSVIAWSNIENKASIRILEKNGFERVAKNGPFCKYLLEINQSF